MVLDYKVQYWLSMLFFCGAVSASTVCSAAMMSEFKDERLKCIVKITGRIAKGDTQKLHSLLKKIALEKTYRGLEWSDGNRTQTGSISSGFTIDLSPDENYRICLDSTGGSFGEAMRMVDYIYGVFGTAIPRDAKCLSACSIVFMAGSHQSGSDAGIIASRIMHATAKLGFHAPNLVVPDGDYTEASVNQAYKVAITAVGRLMMRAGEIKFRHTLISRMLATAPQDMFYIEQVRQAARWRIGVAGTLRPRAITKQAVSEACNNFYAFQADTIGYGEAASDADADYKMGFEVKFARKAYGKQAIQKGYGQEGALTCELQISDTPEPNSVGVITLGSSIPQAAPPWLFFPGKTKLADIARAGGGETKRVDIAAYAKPEFHTKSGTCLVFSRGRQTDKEPCSRTTLKIEGTDLKEVTTETFVWPSGSKTVLVFGTGRATTLNGVPAKVVIGKRGDCWRNSVTGNVFCFES